MTKDRWKTINKSPPQTWLGSTSPEEVSGTMEKPLTITRSIYNPCVDGIFTYGFENKRALTGFLNAALDISLDIEMLELVGSNDFDRQATPTSPKDYFFTFVAKCLSKDGRLFLVQMLYDLRPGYHERALLEHSRMLMSSKDATQSERYDGFYSIVLSNNLDLSDHSKIQVHGQDDTEKDLVNVYDLRNKEDDTPSQVVILRLDRLVKPVAELHTAIEKWAYLFKEDIMGTGWPIISATRDIDANLIENDPAIKDFIQRLDGLPDSVFRLYLYDLREYNSIWSYIADQIKEKKRASNISTALASLGHDDETISTELAAFYSRR